MTERRLEWKALDSLLSAEKNPKRHAAEDIGKSISRFGYVEPVVIDKRTGRLVAGHGRVDALRTAASAGGVPPAGVKVDATGAWLVPVLCGWASKNDAEAAAYLLASNRVSEVGGWDKNELATMLAELADDGLLSGTGFDPPAPMEEIQAQEIDVSTMTAQFFLTVKGPVRKQPEAIERLRKALEEIGEVEVEMVLL